MAGDGLPGADSLPLSDHHRVEERPPARDRDLVHRADGRYYLISEFGERAHWVQNLRRNPEVTFRVGLRTVQGMGRVVDSQSEPELEFVVSRLSIEKYDWGEGLIVELRPD